MGAEVERRRSPRGAGSHQDDNPKGSGRHSKSHKINDDALNDRQTSWSFAVHGGRRRQTRAITIEFSRETGSAQTSSILRVSKRWSIYIVLQGTPHDRCDDGTDAGYVPSPWRDFTTLWIDQGLVCDERCVRKRNTILYTVQASQCELWVWRQTDDAGSTHERGDAISLLAGFFHASHQDEGDHGNILWTSKKNEAIVIPARLPH